MLKGIPRAIDDEELQETVRKKLLGIEADDCRTEKAVSTSEVNKHLAQDWEYVANLTNKKVIIRLRT